MFGYVRQTVQYALLRFKLADEKGASLVETAIIVALFAAAAVAGWQLIKNDITANFQNIHTSLITQ